MESVARDTVYFDVPLSDLLARIEAMAHHFYRRHGRWEPLEEYLSAGHLALSECLVRYDPAQAPPGGFKSYCLFQIEMKMRFVRYAAAGSNNMPKHVKGQRQDPKYTVEGWDHEALFALRSEPARQESITYLHEILDYLAPQEKSTAMLVALVAGEDQPAIADRYQCSVVNVAKHIGKVRQRLRAWSGYVAA